MRVYSGVTVPAVQQGNAVKEVVFPLHAGRTGHVGVVERERGGATTFDYDPVAFVRLAGGRWAGSAGRAAAADSLLSYYESGVPNVTAQIMLKATAGLAAFQRRRGMVRATRSARRDVIAILSACTTRRLPNTRISWPRHGRRSRVSRVAENGRSEESTEGSVRHARWCLR
jgi:hypothetical protein